MQWDGVSGPANSQPPVKLTGRGSICFGSPPTFQKKPRRNWSHPMRKRNPKQVEAVGQGEVLGAAFRERGCQGAGGLDDSLQGQGWVEQWSFFCSPGRA